MDFKMNLNLWFEYCKYNVGPKNEYILITLYFTAIRSNGV